MRRLSIALLACLLIPSCRIAPKAEAFGPEFISKIDSVLITSIDFYSDPDFTKPMPPHEYMAESRKEITRIAIKYLAEYDMRLYLPEVSTVPVPYLTVKMDICIQPSIFTVSLKLRARVSCNDRPLFEVIGTGGAPPKFEAIKESQEELGKKVIEAFAKKLGREKQNPPK